MKIRNKNIQIRFKLTIFLLYYNYCKYKINLDDKQWLKIT